MKTPLYTDAIPSERQELLNRLIGQCIKQLIRYSEIPLNDLLQEYALSPEECFARTVGPFVIYLESGLHVAIIEDVALNSIRIGVEQNEQEEKSPQAFTGDSDFYPIEATSSNAALFWHRIPGQKIQRTNIIRRKPFNVRYEDLPNEIGLLIELEGGDAFVASRWISKGSFDFFILAKHEVNPDIIPDLIGWEQKGD